MDKRSGRGVNRRETGVSRSSIPSSLWGLECFREVVAGRRDYGCGGDEDNWLETKKAAGKDQRRVSCVYIQTFA